MTSCRSGISLGALESGLAALQVYHVAQGHLQLEDFLDRDHPFPWPDHGAQTIEDYGLARPGRAGDEDPTLST